MSIANWMRVLDTVSGLARMGGKLRSLSVDSGISPGQGGTGTLETRLAGVVVAALKEAFDRDRARMDLERSQLESERRRAEEALAAELRRQAAERALGQLRSLAIMASVHGCCLQRLPSGCPACARGCHARYSEQDGRSHSVRLDARLQALTK